jgi:hypothetical protein
MSLRYTRPTNLVVVPDNHSNVKCDAHSLGNVFGIICGVASMREDEPETYKQLELWAKLLTSATDEQLDKIMPKHVSTVVELLVGVIGQFKQDNLKHLMYEGMEQAEEAVANDKIPESQYKAFCDYSMWMLNMLKAIDGYNADKGPDATDYDIAFSSRYTKYKGRNVIDIYIYKPISGSF